MNFENKKVLVGVTGSIAAYKSADLVQRLKELGADVKVVQTYSATQIIPSLTLATLTGHKVSHQIFESETDSPILHIDLARWADLFLIAPCTAHTIGELANGLTGSLLSLTYLAYDKPVYIAPAMNTVMYHSHAVQRNLKILQKKGDFILPTEIGLLACGESGEGKFLPIETLLEYIKIQEVQRVALPQLKNCRCLVVMGHTHEKIDDIRYIANRSSGKTGVAIARALQLQGAQVDVAIGYSELAPLVEFEQVFPFSTTEELREWILPHAKNYQVIVMSAALADFIPQKNYTGKLKSSSRLKNIELKESAHILTILGKNKPKEQVLVGFALENQGQEDLGQKKLTQMGCDLLVINTPLSPSPHSGFGKDKIKATVIKSGENKTLELPLVSKYDLATMLLQKMNSLLEERYVR